MVLVSKNTFFFSKPSVRMTAYWTTIIRLKKQAVSDAPLWRHWLVVPMAAFPDPISTGDSVWVGHQIHYLAFIPRNLMHWMYFIKNIDGWGEQKWKIFGRGSEVAPPLARGWRQRANCSATSLPRPNGFLLLRTSHVNIWFSKPLTFISLSSHFDDRSVVNNKQKGFFLFKKIIELIWFS